MIERNHGDIDHLAALAGLSPAAAAAWIGVTARTWRRWRSGGPPPAAALALALRSGSLGALHPRWAGWTIGPDGLAYAPGYRCGWAPEHVIATWWDQQRAAALRIEILELRGRLALATSANAADYSAGSGGGR